MPVFSFSSAQPPLPPSVIAGISRDIAQWREGGQSLLELPFTGECFRQIQDEAGLRRLLDLPDEYHVLFLQGGAPAHFALLPMNLAGAGGGADYVETGHWSRRAMAEAGLWCPVRTAARGSGLSLPAPETWRISPDAAYCHYTSNETVDGLQVQAVPGTGRTPLAADMSADFLTRPLPSGRFGLIYASSQKNLGVPGVTVVIIRDDLLGRARKDTPAPFNYTRQADAKSRMNTPPVPAIAIMGRMLGWIGEQGGLGVMERRNRRKCKKLYAVIDGGFYRSPLSVRDRSHVSVRFHLENEALEALFLKEAAENGLLLLKGHPSAGGLRASLYNAVSEEAVEALAVFMADFRSRRG